MVEFLGGLGVSIYNAMKVKVENQGAIALAKNPMIHDRLKRIDIQYHFTRGLVKAGRIGLDYVPTREMLADLVSCLWHRAGLFRFLVSESLNS